MSDKFEVGVQLVASTLTVSSQNLKYKERLILIKQSFWF